MPEVELRRDPLGANRGKSFREQAGTSVSRARKHIHDKYSTPPYRPTNRNWEMTFAALGFNRRLIEKFWRLFCQIGSSGGAIQLEHFLEHFGLDWTSWTERCFRHFDTTGGGDIDFLEFLISVWNMCTFKVDSLSNFTFDMYDLDADGELSIPEIEGMVRELFGDDGGKQCLNEAIDFAEARGGALNLNAFIAFTGTHQLLLFPMFQIQRKLQRKVFGIRYWEKVERAAKENFNGPNPNEFNPRHVQILLRTYQTGGAAAVLRHTGDPNAGLRDWYNNQKEHDVVDEAELEEMEEGEAQKTGLQRWNSLRDSVNGKAKAVQQWSSVRKSILDGQVEKVKGMQVPKPKGRGNASESNTRPTATSLPANVAKDLARIRARRAGKQGDQPSAENDSNGKTQSSKPVSALPAHVANDLKRIRERHGRAPPGDNDRRPDPPNDGISRPDPAGLPPNVAADLQRIRARRRTRRSNKEERPSSNGKRKDRPRPRRKSTAVHTNVRRRQAGTMFFKSDSQTEGQHKGWLE
ncbi:hypothetical protein ACHAXT_010805 [Thalassiosira profunda]